MDALKDIINTITAPQIVFPVILLVFFFIFPPTDRLMAINKRLGINKLWTKGGGIVLAVLLFSSFIFGLTDPNFTLIVTSPEKTAIMLVLIRHQL